MYFSLLIHPIIFFFPSGNVIFVIQTQLKQCFASVEGKGGFSTYEQVLIESSVACLIPFLLLVRNSWNLVLFSTVMKGIKNF